MAELDLTTASRDNPLRVGGYDVIGVLGRGGMGTVYRAVDVEHGTAVALKTLRHLNPDALLRFKQEFRQAADLGHPNLVSLYELSCEEDLWFFTMEHVDGLDFVNRLGDRPTLVRGSGSGTGQTRADTATLEDSGSPGSDEGVELSAVPHQLEPEAVDQLRAGLAQLVEAVRALHRAGLLHLDIKPSNVLVDATGRVVLLDFGIARALDAGTDDGPTPRFVGSRRPVLGTPAWMAPEQHERTALTEATDWYAVGLLLYTALTGTRPFAAHDISALEYAKRHTRPIPPRQVVDVPEDLSSLAMALLHPDPEQRPDGEEVARIVSGVAGHDPVPVPAGPAIVGRVDERNMVRAAFNGVVGGRSAVVQIRGPSGVGKSALLRDLRGQTRKTDVLFLRGRCYERESVPYKAFDGMLDDLAARLATRPGHIVHAFLPEWTEELTRVFPVLAGVPAVHDRLQSSVPIDPSVPGAEIQRRAVEALRSLFTNLAARRPCVLEVDDLQWADADSARALVRLLEPPVPKGLLVLLSYRATEAAESEVVAPALDRIARISGPNLTLLTLDVGPLARTDAEALARVALGGREASPELVTSIARNSGGVPFFVEELAQMAAQQIGAGQEPTVDLADVVTRRVDALRPVERALVETLAIANNPIPLGAAVSVAGIEDRGIRRALWTLRRREFVRATGIRPDDTIELRHDRLRESIVDRLTDARADTIHLGLGLALATRATDPEGDDAWLYDAARHLNAVSSHPDADSRLRAAHLNLQAGRKARRSAAFDLAYRWFDAGTRILGDDAWTGEYDLALALHEGAADAAYLSATWDAVERHVSAIESHAHSDPDRLGAWEARIDADIARNAYDAAVDAGRSALARLGVDLPATPTMDEVGAAFQATMQALAPLGPGGFANLDLSTDVTHMAAMRLQSRITSAAYFARPTLLPLLGCRMVAASVAHGLAPATPYALSILGIVLNTLGMHREAHAWGQVALSLVDRFDDHRLDARTGHVVHDLVCNWIVPLQDTLPNMLAVHERGKALGDVEYAAYAAHAYVHNALYAGEPLEALLARAIELGDFMRGHDQVNALHVHEPFEQLLRAFTGRTQDPACLDGDGFSEAASLAAAEAAGSRSALCLIRVVMGMARYAAGQVEAASEVFEAARPYLDGMPSVWHGPMFHQYATLAILGLPEDRRAPLMEHVEASLNALQALAAVGPMNFAHRVDLVEAERARVTGDLPAALAHCERAVLGARDHGWPCDLALALQLRARCHDDAHDPAAARTARLEARDALTAWGATALARRVEM